MKRPQSGFAALVLLAALSAPAIADDWQDCKQSNADKAIAACTQIIGKGPASDKQMAVAYTYRGNANRSKGEYDRAFADFAKAVAIDPKYAYAYISRGSAYRSKGEHDKAIADHTRAIEIDPKSVYAYNERGIAYRAKGEPDKAIADHSKAIEINPKDAGPYVSRGHTYGAKGERDLAIADYTRAIAINPKDAVTYLSRGNAYSAKGERDVAIADYTKAIELDPKSANAYNNRGIAYRGKGEHDKAIADHSKAIEINPKDASPYVSRGHTYSAKGERDLAIADYTRAIGLDPKSVSAYISRGNVYDAKNDHDRAITDYTKAIEIDPKSALAYSNRGKAHEAKGSREAAIADYEKLVALPATSPTEQQRQEVARQRIARLKQAPTTRGVTVPRRVALVIGNSNYSNAGVLPNPVNDARAIAASLTRLQFAVSEHYDVTREKMGRALKDFGDRAEGAEWAVVFFAGHGLEINGTAYLVPVDAELKRDSHVADETLSLTQVQAKVDAASKLGLVILDACRNNPFVSRMVRSGGASRSIGRGLAAIEPEGNVLVAYAAKHGTTAEDGTGKNSPFTEALLAHIEEPGLEINFLFRKVRDRVRERTAKQQEPFLYGSLGSEPLYFKAATAR